MEKAVFEGIELGGNVALCRNNGEDTFVVLGEENKKVVLKNTTGEHRMVSLLQQGQTVHLGDLPPDAEVTIPLVRGLAWVMVASDLVNFKTKLIYVGMSQGEFYKAPETRGIETYNSFIQRHLKAIE